MITTPPLATHASAVDRWALLVGISAYQDARLTLRYAARDASSLREVLLQPTAGAFAPDHVLTLLDGEATNAAVTRALRTFLKRPAADDLVVIFFACHGSFDPERPAQLYLLPHDADPRDISGTALPMREVDIALRETLHSRHVVVLMDSCHSGGLAAVRTGSLRAREAEADDLNQYLGALSEARGGVSLMTSAMGDESSREGEQWGGGHGVFTHHLLEGLKGKADRGAPDGVVTFGKLFDYVAEKVKQDTEGHQQPHIGAGADRALPLAVLAATTAEQHLELAALLAGVAQWLDEPLCWRGAAAQCLQAMRLRGGDANPALAVDTAFALAQAGELDEAHALLARTPRDAPGVRALLGLVEAAQGRADDARATLLSPVPAAPWVGALYEAPAARGPRVALLVALDRVNPASYGGWDGSLKSPEAEAHAFGELLARELGFDEIVWLLGPQATSKALLRTLAQIVYRSEGIDSLVVLLSGHGSEVPVMNLPSKLDGTFVAFDAQVTASEIDAVLRQSKAGRTTLIVSSAHSGHFANLARGGGYEALTSCAANQVDMDGPQFSVFMQGLFEALTISRESASLRAQVQRFVKLQQGSAQVPQFELDPDLPPLVGRGARDASQTVAKLAHPLLGGAVSADERWLGAALDLALRAGAPAAFANVLAVAAWAHEALHARLAAWPADAAVSAATRGVALRAAVRGANAAARDAALRCLSGHGDLAPLPAWQDQARKLADEAARQGPLASRLRVLLVGLSRGANGHDGQPDALASVEAMRVALQAAGVANRQLLVLIDAQASTKAVRGALRRLAGRRGSLPLLIYWCGSGDLMHLQCHDNKSLAQDELLPREGIDITLLADGIDHAIAPWRGADEPGPPMTVVLHRADANAKRTKSSSRARPAQVRLAPVAQAFIEALRSRGQDLGALTAMDLDGHKGVTVAQTRVAGGTHLIGDPLATRIDGFVVSLRQAMVGHAAMRVAAFLEQRGGGDGALQLQLGVLRHALADTDAALAALERALALTADDAHEQARVRLMLGRVLLESGRDRARAASECRSAAKLDARLSVALYWQGRAIAELIQREAATQASEALTDYLSRGAPAGRREEVQQLLDDLTRR